MFITMDAAQAFPDGRGPAARKTVMVVDDDRLVLLTLAHGLRVAGFDVLEADNGDDAILMARTQRPDLALLDIRMQGLSGFDVAQYLKDYAHIPFIFVSAYDDQEIRQQAEELGALACLSKPVHLPALAQLVADALAPGPAAQGVDATGSGTQAAPARPEPDALAEPPDGHLQGEHLEIGLALGLLMHRLGLDRGAALQHLSRLAQAQSQAPHQVAQALVKAHESQVNAS